MLRIRHLDMVTTHYNGSHMIEADHATAQVNHRHAERRALVAEACGAFAPYVAPEMRPSLVLSILQQMATDADGIVRRAVVQSLTQLLPLLPDLDKFQAVSPHTLWNSSLVMSLHVSIMIVLQ